MFLATWTKTINVTEFETADIISGAFCAVNTSLPTSLFYCNDVYSAGTLNLSNGFQLTNSNPTEQYGLICIDPAPDLSINVFDTVSLQVLH